MNLRRKRMMLMDGQWYGYLRTATGNPLTLQNAKRLRKLTIYGNAVQDGTPSPDAPVEVQLCGDRTGNLLDVTQISGAQIEVADNKIYLLNDYACSTNISPKKFLEMTGLNPGDTITCSNDTEIIHGVANPVLGRVSFSNRKDGDAFILKANLTHVSTIPSDFNNDNYGNMLLYGAHQADESGERLAVMYNIAIYKGSYTADTLPAYEPYGYKVSGRADGVNLLDIGGETSTSVAGVTWTINNDGSVTVSGTPTGYSDVDFPRMKAKPNTIYTLSTNIEIPNVVGVINFYDADNTLVATNTGTNSSSMLQAVSPEGTTNVIVVFKRNNNNVAIPETTFYPMLVQGTYTAETIPPYEPYQPPQDFAVYLPEQIAKVGDVADEVVVDMEKQTAELVRRIERNEFKGTDAWKNDWFPAIVKNLPETAPAIPSARCVSNHFDHNGDTSVPITQIANVVGTTISVARANLISGVTDAETFKTWLSDKNVYAYYPLATPVTTDITSLQQWDAMPQVSGTVTLTLSAEVDPSGAEAVYYSKERGE